MQIRSCIKALIVSTKGNGYRLLVPTVLFVIQNVCKPCLHVWVKSNNKVKSLSKHFMATQRLTAVASSH